MALLVRFHDQNLKRQSTVFKFSSRSSDSLLKSTLLNRMFYEMIGEFRDFSLWWEKYTIITTATIP